VAAAPVFRGTRVPVRTLLDFLTAGDTLDAFLTNFSNVSREHAVAVLHIAQSVAVPSTDTTATLMRAVARHAQNDAAARRKRKSLCKICRLTRCESLVDCASAVVA
jgi:uncharacterized protein (DUF433 family)